MTDSLSIENNGSECRPDAKKGRRKRVCAREKILIAGRAICADGRYLRVTIEEIADTAGISRASFYKNFSSKEELLRQLAEDQVEWYVRQFRTIAPSKARSTVALVAWFRGFIERYREVNELMAHFRFAISIKEAYTQNQAARRRVIETLGHRLPELRLFLADGSLDTQREVEVLLWIYQLEQICLNVAFAPQTFPVESALSTLAQRFIELLD